MSSSSSSSYSLSKINPKLLRRIYRACRPTLNEPNLSLNLEICDYVNAKQGSTPREAAIAVAKLISQRDPQTSELAVALLDNLVKNCGYPFQLQVSRKEFLNELVKRFPERPPPRYSRVQRLVLAQIEEWHQTICRTSKYKEDFGYIRDMHRLLSHKGYVFPEVKVEDVAVLNPSDNLQSLEELQKEEAIVHSAKLQELIRRGRPQDLQEANRLMKIMAGFKDDSTRENKKQITDDLSRLKRKAEILAEMLNNIEASGGKVDESEATIELYSAIKSSQKKITKIIEEENSSESTESVGELLGLNDIINSVISKFELLKAGDIESASKVVIGGSTNSTGGAELNLIDFDDDEPVGGEKDQSGYNDLLSDLSNLAFTSDYSNSAGNNVNNPTNLFGSGGSISLGNSLGQNFKQPQPQKSVNSTSSNFDLLADLNSPSPQLQSNTQASAAAASNSLDPFGFNFPSSTPSQVQTSSFTSPNSSTSPSKTIPINQSAVLKIEFDLAGDDTNVIGKARFSNVQSQPLNQFKFLIAVPKSCRLTLKPQSSDVLYGYGGQTITQEFSIENSLQKQLKVKWKAEYVLAGEKREETGVSVLA
ncbi:ADP-ribosylation factor-binding protein Gga2p [[Candida] anglica]